ncbi:LysR family transcriptional regulator [Shewanella eurypsychrophilus]|uniref:LysR family transcriptional regulator n=1 Tax=Shewanella eurypsychrophilus TaxID=2593656 RepID=A0ABX6V836_9GAMM|nr:MULTISPECIES: LysR family transcriptional regulator [Shewanella]QFU23285.1 LysR family transcriptional regulator [Shewanella sp. YLB-09]QPG58514.1 LysR family transcriptional regulator [Shewanella eurypsychrophilus]
MRIEDLNLFTIVVKLGSFTAAANALDLPRANVSRRIGELEKSLNAQLFFRTTRQLRLTQHGEAYYHELLTVLEGFEQAKNKLLDIDEKPVGKIKVGFLPESDEALQPALAKFQQMYPEIELDLRITNNYATDIYTQALDFVIHAGKVQDSGFIARRLLSLGRSIYASPEYLNKHGVPKTLQQLAQHEAICYRWPDGTLDDKWDLITDIVNVNCRFSCNHMGFVRRAIVGGQGIGFMPPLFALAAIESQSLVRILPEYESKKEDVWLIYPDRKGISLPTRLLIDFLLQEIPERAGLS